MFDGILEELKGFAGFVWEVITEITSNLPKIFSFCLWIIAAIFILPCVFVAGNIYPIWEKWGEDF